MTFANLDKACGCASVFSAMLLLSMPPGGSTALVRRVWGNIEPVDDGPLGYGCELNNNMQAKHGVVDLSNKTLRECAEECNSNGRCDVFVSNTYGACYLKQGFEDKQFDQVRHITIGCRKCQSEGCQWCSAANPDRCSDPPVMLGEPLVVLAECVCEFHFRQWCASALRVANGGRLEECTSTCQLDVCMKQVLEGEQKNKTTDTFVKCQEQKITSEETSDTDPEDDPEKNQLTFEKLEPCLEKHDINLKHVLWLLWKSGRTFGIDANP